MKKIVILLLLVSFAFTAAAQNTQQDRTMGGYDVNFNNITMKEFITFVASFTNTNIVYKDADLKGNVSIISEQPMSAKDVLDIFYATLASNGLIAVQEGSYIRVMPDRDMGLYMDGFSDTAAAVDEGEFVTVVIRLQRYNSVALANTLNRVKSRFGVVEPIRGVNAILVRDFGSRIDKIRTICKRMDSFASGYQLQSITIQNNKASRVEQLVIRMYNDLVRNSLAGQLPVIISDDFSNVLVVVCSEDEYEMIQYFVSQVDVGAVTEDVLPKVFYLKYANAEDVEKVINKLIIGNEPTAAQVPGAVAPVRSAISSDKSTNAILAVGNQEVYASIERMIEKLDIPRKQVYVEALILETSVDGGNRYGVEWFGGGAGGDIAGFGNLRDTGQLGNIMGDVTGQTSGSGMAQLPGGFSGGIIGDVITFNGITFPSIGAFLYAIRTDAAINIVSNPQILTLDNEEAEVFVGENRPYVTSEKYDANNNPIQTFDYRDVGIRLKVIPHIAGDGLVSLEIEQEVNKVSPSATTSASSPVTLTRSTKTKVQLYDRSIMVIGGLMKDDSSVSTSGVPVLSRIPLLGWLFKSQSTTSEKTNLLVFITAHIIDTREDMQEVLERRGQATSLFNSKSDSDLDRKDDDEFIPMQQDVKDAIYGIGSGQ